MNEFVVKVLQAEYITHDVKRFAIQKPRGYTFIPGQATDVSINLPDWKDKLRPFTFTSLAKWDYLEFMIKIYTERKGVTDKLGTINAGAELIIREPFGAIHYKGPGVFLAAGAGITPFIAIFRELYKNKGILGNRLIYSNRTSQDIIMDEELRQMFKDNFINVFTRENVIGFLDRRIGRDFLIENIADFGQHFYVCGPDAFVKNITELLLDLGASGDALVIEK